MKRGKRIGILAAGAAMAFGLFGCGEKEMTAYERYEAVQKQIREAGGMEYDTDSNIKMKMSGIGIDLDMDMKTILEGEMSSEDLKFYTELGMNFLGQELDMKMWYSDGLYYMNAMDQKVCYPVNFSAVQEQIGNQAPASGLSEEDFKSLDVEKDGENYRILYTADGEQMEEMIQSALGAAGTSLDMDLKMEDMSGTLVVDKENRPVSAQAAVKGEAVIQGQQAEMEITVDMTYKDLGKEVQVELPDPEEYQKIEAPAA